MFEKYYIDGEVRSEFRKEFISLWQGWLGKDRYHLLDLVTKQEWERFHSLISTISNSIEVGVANRDSLTIEFPKDLTKTFKSYAQSQESSADSFAQYVVPELECLITEEWDYTYILWHQGNGAVEALAPFIERCHLKHFAD